MPVKEQELVLIAQAVERVNCFECRFFNRFDVGKTDLGYCQIDPPVIIQSLGNKKGSWPIVEDKDWCGQGERI